MNEKKIIIVLTLFTILFTLIGSTFAYWNWQISDSDRTSIVFTSTPDFSCAADGGGNITSSDAMIAPTTCIDPDRAIRRTLTITPTMNSADFIINMNLYLDVNLIGDGLSNSENFKYVVTTNPDSCDEDVVTFGNFNGVQNGDKIKLINKEFLSSDEEIYYLYIWLDEAETSVSTMGQSFNLSLNGECSGKKIIPPYREDILNGADPILTTGMIPVTIDNNGNVKTANIYEEWYNYNNKEWANAVLVTSDSRDGYYESDGLALKVNEPIPEDNILAYYVWIPKYSYKINNKEDEISIIFNNVSDGYIEHSAFLWDDDSNGIILETENLNGLWVGKFETGHSTLLSSTNNTMVCTNSNCSNADDLVIKPNIYSKRADRVSSQFYVSRSFSRSLNPFGLVSSKVDTHMMKNSEWGAVAYLSHSKYGINDEIRLNNNSLFKTGCGALNENGAATTDCEIAYGDVSTGIYPQSTTGNITGIFDMSGGSNEYVMGYYSKANANFVSGNNSYFGYTSTTNYASFSNVIDLKYWDNFSSMDFTTACDGSICYGHALSETSGWYSDLSYFVSEKYPWLCRGGYYDIGESAGLFLSAYYYGNASASYTWRMILIVKNIV